MEQGTAAITCNIRGCPNEFRLSDPSHMLYVCTADDIQCKEWLAVIPEVSLRHVDDKLCLCSLHFDGGVNVSGDATPTIFPPVPGLSTSEPQQQSKTHGGEQAMIGPATTIKQELVDEWGLVLTALACLRIQQPMMTGRQLRQHQLTAAGSSGPGGYRVPAQYSGNREW